MRNFNFRIGVVLTIAYMITSCKEVAPPTGDDPSDAGPRDSSVQGLDTSDVSLVDSPDLACSEEFLSIEADSNDGGVLGLCRALTSFGLAIDVADCQPRYTTGEVVGTPGSVLATVSGDGTLFSALGPALVGILVRGPGLPCGPADASCFFRSEGSACRAVITQAGTAGAVGALALAEPCVLTHVSDSSGAEYRLTVRSLRVRGQLRVRNELNQGSVDAGGRLPDCGAR